MLDTVIMFQMVFCVNTGLLKCEEGTVTFKGSEVIIESPSLTKRHTIVKRFSVLNETHYLKDSSGITLNPNRMEYNPSNTVLYYLYYKTTCYEY